jgi:hypothetical protein
MEIPFYSLILLYPSLVIFFSTWLYSFTQQASPAPLMDWCPDFPSTMKYCESCSGPDGQELLLALLEYWHWPGLRDIERHMTQPWITSFLSTDLIFSLYIWSPLQIGNTIEGFNFLETSKAQCLPSFIFNHSSSSSFIQNFVYPRNRKGI